MEQWRLGDWPNSLVRGRSNVSVRSALPNTWNDRWSSEICLANLLYDDQMVFPYQLYILVVFSSTLYLSNIQSTSSCKVGGCLNDRMRQNGRDSSSAPIARVWWAKETELATRSVQLWTMCDNPDGSSPVSLFSRDEWPPCRKQLLISPDRLVF